MAEWFKAATYNVFNGTPADLIAHRMKELQDDGVSIVFMNESHGEDIKKQVQAWTQYRVGPDIEGNRLAWLPGWWQHVNWTRAYLSTTPWFTKNGGERLTDSPVHILCDMEGQSLTVVPYHMPPHTQVPKPPKNRWEALQEAMDSLEKLAEGAKTHGFLAGGDDNVDEQIGAAKWDFMRTKATGLRQVRAPQPTYGKRYIDDFRIIAGGNLGVGNGSVQSNPATESPQHKIHVRRFNWKIAVS